MTSLTHQIYTGLEQHIADGLIARKPHPTKDLSLLCYTGKQFHDTNFAWSELAIACRGLIVDRNNTPLNSPMPKIFNIGEVTQTDKMFISRRLEIERWVAYRKMNGHLAIASFINGEFIVTTKGSWDMEFVEKDKQLLQPYLNNLIDYYNNENVELNEGLTLGFEIIADYDKHTLYDIESERYGKNVPVLLFVRFDNFDAPHAALCAYEERLKCKAAEVVCTSDSPRKLDTLYLDKDTEGVVIKFANGDRVKVKTHEYLHLRYMKEYSKGGVFKRIFKQFVHVDGSIVMPQALSNIAEEYHYVFKALYNEYLTKVDVYYNDLLTAFYALCNTLDITEYSKENAKKFSLHVKTNNLNKDLLLIIHNKKPFSAVKKQMLKTFDFDLFVSNIIAPATAATMLSEQEANEQKQLGNTVFNTDTQDEEWDFGY